VFTAARIWRIGTIIGGLPCGWLITSPKDGFADEEPPHPSGMAGRRPSVPHVGDPVAVVHRRDIPQGRATPAEKIAVELHGRGRPSSICLKAL